MDKNKEEIRKREKKPSAEEEKGRREERKEKKKKKRKRSLYSGDQEANLARNFGDRQEKIVSGLSFFFFLFFFICFENLKQEC